MRMLSCRPAFYNQILFAIKGFYQYLDMHQSSAVFGKTETHRGYDAPDSYKPFLHHISGRKARRMTERRSDKAAKPSFPSSLRRNPLIRHESGRPDGPFTGYRRWKRRGDGRLFAGSVWAWL